MWTAMFSTKRSVHFLLLRGSDFLLSKYSLIQLYFLYHLVEQVFLETAL